MNLWGFGKSFLDEADRRFAGWLHENLPKNPLKCEYFLPTVASELIDEGKAAVTVLKSTDKWYGVTYREDKPPWWPPSPRKPRRACTPRICGRDKLKQAQERNKICGGPLDFLRRSAYTKVVDETTEPFHGSTKATRSPLGTANTKRASCLLRLVLTGLELFLKPLADVVADHTRCDGQYK